MLEWYFNNKVLIDFAVDFITIISFIVTIYTIFNILRYLKTRKLRNKINEIQQDEKSFDMLSRELENYIGTGGHDYGVRLVYYKNYPYKLDKDGFRKYLFWYKISEKHIPSGYISNTSVSIIEELSFSGDKLYYSDKTHKWFIDNPNKQFERYRELPYDMMVYHIPFQNIIGYRFGSSDWTDRNEPIFFTKYKYNSQKLFSNNIIAVMRSQYGCFPSEQLILHKTKRIKRYKILLYKIKSGYNRIKRKIKIL